MRWLLLSLLVLKLGPGAVGLVAHHALTVLLVVGVLAVVGFGWWWLRKGQGLGTRSEAVCIRLHHFLKDLF